MLKLNSSNISQYLLQERLISPDDIEGLMLHAGKDKTKNFNVRIDFAGTRSLLIKQERPTFNGDFPRELLNEWLIQSFVQQDPSGDKIRHLMREMVHFDAENLIAVCQYLADYQELHADILQNSKCFPVQIAEWLGEAVGQLHRATLDHEAAYVQMTGPGSFWKTKGAAFNLLQTRITPDILGVASRDYLRFISLYQRFDSLDEAVRDTIRLWQPCCVVHNDLNISNILVHSDWAHFPSNSKAEGKLKIIDWERCSWGDPVFDLGYLIANYLLLWLASMVIDPEMSLEETVQSASISLQDVRPSICQLIQAYLATFPEILARSENFSPKLLRFTGLSLLIQAQARVECHQVLANSDIYALQIAKGLLTRPDSSFPKLFGKTIDELIKPSASPPILHI